MIFADLTTSLLLMNLVDFLKLNKEFNFKEITKWEFLDVC